MDRRAILVRLLAEIEEQIQLANAIIEAPSDKDTKLLAQVTLADLENARYEAEGELMRL